MAEAKCPHCGSKYVIHQGKTDGFDKSSENYLCQSCKKTFSVVTEKRSAHGEWLMTFYDENYGYSNINMSTSVEVYRTQEGNISINQRKRRECVSGEVKLQLYVTKKDSILLKENDSFFLTLSTYQTPNDSNGTLFSVRYIEMNEELKNLAMQNEAMRITWSKSRFDLTNYRSAIISNDICEFLKPLIDARGKSAVGCYVATAVYGSYNCPQVWTLRRFRDNILAETWYGRTFIHMYYAISPTLVKWFGKSSWFKALWRGPLDRMVKKLRQCGVEDTPYQDRNW